MTEDWEQSHLPLDDPRAVEPPSLKAPSVSQCANCGELVHKDNVVIKQYYNGQMVDVKHYCSHGCHHQWYINRLRQWGM